MSCRFPPQKLFTNALLGNHEITTLIRDTEPHERALFSVDPTSSSVQKSSNVRRATMFGGDAANRRRTMGQAQNRQSSVVARVLGSDMLRQIQQSSSSRGRKGVDVDILLQGAERLCAVYSVPGASERILALRNRYAYIAESVATYEAKVVQQQARLNRMNANADYSMPMDEDIDMSILPSTHQELVSIDLQAEQAEIQELEARKKALEERVAGIEKDLGGLLR